MKAYTSHKELLSQGIDLYRLVQEEELERFVIKDESEDESEEVIEEEVFGKVEGICKCC